MRILVLIKWPLVVCAIAVAVGVWLIWSLFPGPGISFIVPDEKSFDVIKPGRYTLWTEAEASFHGRLMTFATGLPPGVTIAISKPDGTTVPVHSQWPTTQRDLSKTIQVAIGTVSFDSPGSYRVTAGGLEEKRALYLDQSDMRAFFLKVTVAMCLPIVLFGAAVWAVLLLYLKRGNKPA